MQMRDKAVTRCLSQWEGFSVGMIISQWYPTKDSYLSQILESEVDNKYYLSSRACQGILRRAKERGKKLPEELEKALIAQSCECGVDARGGGKGPLVSNEKSLTLATNNDQTLFTKVYSIAGNIIDRKPQNGGNGKGYQENISYTLTAMDRHAVAETYRSDVTTVGALRRRDYKGIGNQDLPKCDKLIIEEQYKVRRLTPLEAERLQGWPDGYTDVPLNGKPASDANRYKALGNGMAQPCARFVIRRIAEVANE